MKPEVKPWPSESNASGTAYPHGYHFGAYSPTVRTYTEKPIHQETLDLIEADRLRAQTAETNRHPVGMSCGVREPVEAMGDPPMGWKIAALYFLAAGLAAGVVLVCIWNAMHPVVKP